MKKLLKYLVGLSYISLILKEKEIGRQNWIRNKRRFNRLINKKILNYLSNQTQHYDTSVSESQQKELESINDILLRHYKRRIQLYKLLNYFRLGGKSVFIQISIFMIYMDRLLALVKSTIDASYTRKVGIDLESTPVCIAIGFPEHSFNLSNSGKKIKEKVQLGPFSSFADYYEASSNSDTKLISIDEYIRPSKKRENENGISNNSKCLYPDSLDREILVPNKSVIFYFVALYRIATCFLWLIIKSIFSKSSFIFNTYGIKTKIIGKKYERILRRLELSNNSLLSIYTPIFNNLGDLVSNGKYKKKILFYNYSHNMFIPPIEGLDEHGMFRVEQKLDSIISEVLPSTLCLNGNALGFTNIFRNIDEIKQRINSEYGCNLPVGRVPQTKEIPMLLGFEVITEATPKNNPKYFALFDVPPETRNTQFQRAILGDLSCDIEMIKEFMEEVIEETISSGYGVLFKPKYSVKNYHLTYQKFIQSMLNDYEGKLYLINPYSDMIELLQNVVGCISYPYTSTKIVADYLGLPSIYYVPGRFGEQYTTDENCIVGRSELTNYLSSLKQNNVDGINKRYFS